MLYLSITIMLKKVPTYYIISIISYITLFIGLQMIILHTYNHVIYLYKTQIQQFLIHTIELTSYFVANERHND